LGAIPVFSSPWHVSSDGEAPRRAQGPTQDVIRRDGDVVIRRRVSLWEPQPAKNALLMSIYRYWEALRPEGMLPKRSAFDLDKLRPVMGMTTLVDVEAEDPLDYQYRLFGSNVPLSKNISNLRVRELESAAYRDSLVKDYHSAKMLGVPAYHEIVACLDWRRHSYARLVLPFSKDGRAVNQLMVCSAHEKFPDLLKLLD
jgi:hypothetical protein